MFSNRTPVDSVADVEKALDIEVTKFRKNGDKVVIEGEVQDRDE